jgi:hypothetical protein
MKCDSQREAVGREFWRGIANATVLSLPVWLLLAWILRS